MKLNSATDRTIKIITNQKKNNLKPKQTVPVNYVDVAVAAAVLLPSKFIENYRYCSFNVIDNSICFWLVLQ